MSFMRRFQRIIAALCLGALLSPGLATLSKAADEAVPTLRMPQGGHIILSAIPLDLGRLAKDGSGGATTALHVAPTSPSVSMQTSGGGWKGLSTAKKTWIIVGIVVGTAAIVVAVSNRGDGGSGGGGY